MRFALAVALCGLWAVACVRASEPDAFICRKDADCPGGTWCMDQQCLPERVCTTRADCRQLQECRNGSCVDVECFFMADCGTLEVCNNNVCEAVECFVDGDCPDGICSSSQKCVECELDTTCSPYACSSNRCLTSCNGSVDCQSSNACVDGVCLTSAEVTACGGTCVGLGAECASQSQCVVGNCCVPDASSEIAVCQEAECEVARVGEPCTTSEFCQQGQCLGGICVAELGDSCGADADCLEGRCCARDPTNPTCELECLLTGDSCDDSDLGGCDIGFCENQASTNGGGYCSKDCTGGCGPDSRGISTVCVQLRSGASPPAACKPSCETQADCQAIHPDLGCFGVPNYSTTRACDFSNTSWAP